ncbi:MAG: MFS transporter, partial [Anaerolineales bacterium]|nr:MFS transporter [Anaerolineales bacterium]
MTDATSSRPAHFRWNYAVLVIEAVASWLALTFVSVSSVLPAFARELTSSEPLIGLTSTIFYGGWNLPQIFIGRMIAGKPRKKPYLMFGLVGRVAFWVLGLALWLRPEMRPSSALLLLYVCLGAWIVTDAVVSLAWADIVGRAIPTDRRGSMMGLGQCLAGICGIGAGVLIGAILGSPRYPFPRNYALLFILAAAFFMPGIIALASLREPAAVPAGPSASTRPRGHWLRAIASDRTFRRFVACRMLLGVANIALPFYVGHAQDVLNLPPRTIGTFVIAQTIASVVSSLALGLVSDRWGSRRAIHIGSFAATAAPLFALVAHLTASPILTLAYPVVFVALGISNSAVWSGFFNYLISSAPEDDRATYVGLANTI